MTAASPVEHPARSVDDPEPGRGASRPPGTVPRHRPGDADGLIDRIAAERDGLVAYLAGRVDDRHVAEDLAQDVLTSALAHLDKVDPERPLWPWLMTMARNRLTDHYRRSQTAQELHEHPRVREALSPYTAEDPPHAFEDLGTRMGEHQLLGEAMRLLTPRQRSALLLHDVGGWSSEQIGELHGRNRNAVHQLIHRARSRARDEYQRLSGDKGALGLLPWPLVWASGLLRRTAARTRRNIQDWQLALPAFGESMASVAVVASLGLGAGTMWASDPAEALENPDLTDLSDAALAASAEAAAPQLVPPEPTTSTEEVDLGDQQRLAAAISDAEPEAFEVQRAAQAEAAEEAEAEVEESDVEVTVDSDDQHLGEAAETVRSSEATVEPSVETSESDRYDHGKSIDAGATTEIEAGTLEGGQWVDSDEDWNCDHDTSGAVCETSRPADDEPATDLEADMTQDEQADVTSIDTENNEVDVTSDTQDGSSDTQEDIESVEVLTDDNCDLDETIGSACQAASSEG